MRFLAGATVAFALLFATAATAQISLGTAQSFGVLGGAAVTNTGPTVISGNLGVSPGTAITGFPPGLITPPGVLHSADAVAAQAQSDTTTAYVAIATTPTQVDLTNTDLGGLTLTPGVYGFGATAQLTGTLTLNALGNPNAVFLFKIGSSLTTASGASVVVVNGGSACNVYWQVGSSAVVGTGTNFSGNILALASITLNTGVTVNGRALARNGSVTLASNNVVGCASAPAICPSITLAPSVLPAGTSGAAFATGVSASGGAGPYAYQVSSGALPAGVSLNAATGAIAGTPTAIGTFNFTITATDANGCPGSRAYAIVIAAPACPVISLNPLALPSAVVGTAYSQLLTSSGGVAPYTYTRAGTLPPGLVLGAGGSLTGTPTTAGLYSFTVTSVDAHGCPGSQAYTVAVTSVSGPVVTVGPVNLPAGTVSTPYTAPVVASGGTPSYTYSISSGTLPPGLTLNSATGAITGTPTGAGTFNFTITATDSLGNSGLRAYTVVVSAVPVVPVTVAPPTLPGGTVGTPYTPTITATGGTAPYSYGVASGALPPGLTLNPNTGAIAGTPTSVGTFTFTVRVTDTAGNVGFVVYSVSIVAAPFVPGDVSAIPTLSQWGLVLLVSALFALSIPFLRRR